MTKAPVEPLSCLGRFAHPKQPLAPELSEAEVSCAENSDQADDDEVDRDDVIQQAGHHKNQDAGNQRN